MQQTLFDAIVVLFEWVCRHTGLRYAELNILVYVLLVPASWCTIVWWRTRQLPLLAALHWLTAAGYLGGRVRLQDTSDTFYAANIRTLEYLGQTWGAGYTRISLWIGVAVPLAIWAALVWLPKKFVASVYLTVLALNLMFYIWVLLRFG